MTWVHKANLKGKDGIDGKDGDPGEKGNRGRTGLAGAPGPANQLTVGAVAVGTTAGVAITGTSPAQKVNFTIPRGAQGLPGTNAVPADAAVAGYISTDGDSLTKTALLAALAAAYPTVVAPEPSGSDDTAALASFITANAGKVLSLPTGRHYITLGGLTLPSETVLLGNYATLDCTGMTDGTSLAQRFAIRSDGSLGTEALIDAPIAKWAKVVTDVTSTAALAAGDMVLLSNSEVPVPGMVRPLNDRHKGELNEIASVDSPTQVTLRYGAMFAYGSTDLSLRKVNPVEGVSVESLDILLGGVDSAHNGIQISLGRDINMNRVSVDGAEDTGLSFRTVLNGKIERPTVRNSTSSNKTGSSFGPTGYGVAILDGSRHVTVEGGYFYDNRHHIAGGGMYPPSQVDILNNHGQRASSAAYDCHESTIDWTFEGNTTEGSTHGFYLRGQYITARGNTVQDCSAEAFAVHTFDQVAEQRGIKVIDNKATNTAFGISVGKTGSEFEYVSYDVEVSDNTLNYCGTNPIRIRNFVGAKVGGNTINGGSGHSIRLEGPSSVVRSSGLTMWTNDINGAAQCAYDLRYIDGINLTGGIADTPGQYPLQMVDCTDTITTAFQGKKGGYGGIFISGGARHQINVCEMTGSTNASIADGVRVDSSADVTVLGGIYAQARWAVWTSNTDGVIVQLVNARNSGSKIKVDDATTQSVGNNII